MSGNGPKNPTTKSTRKRQESKRNVVQLVKVNLVSRAASHWSCHDALISCCLGLKSSCCCLQGESQEPFSDRIAFASGCPFAWNMASHQVAATGKRSSIQVEAARARSRPSQTPTRQKTETSLQSSTKPFSFISLLTSNATIWISDSP